MKGTTPAGVSTELEASRWVRAMFGRIAPRYDLANHVLSLNLAWLSPLLIFFGVVVFLSRRSTRAGQIGRVAIGLGLIVLALQLVAAAAAPITSAQGVRVIFGTLSGDPMLDMLIGAVFTMMSFSSLAVILLTASFAATHVVSVPVALCLVLGANLGSAFLALIVNARTPGGGRRVAFGNLLFKSAGCVVFLLALSPVMDLIGRTVLPPTASAGARVALVRRRIVAPVPGSTELRALGLGKLRRDCLH